VQRLAERFGIGTQYIDGLGQERQACDAAVLAVLRGLGVDIERVDDAGDVLARLNDQPQAIVEPCHAFFDPGACAVPVFSSTPSSYEAVLALESGEVHSWSGKLAELPQSASGAYQLRLEGLPLGYHRLELALGQGRAQTHVFHAPPRAFGAPDGRREWGMFAPLYAVRGESDWGVGDLGLLKEMTAWASSLGARYVATLPLLAANYREDFQTSPYSPVSRLFWNELFLDVPALLDQYQIDDSEIRARLSSEELVADLQRLRALEYVDYREAARVKRDVLERIAERVFGGQRGELADFAQSRPHLDAYARFRAAMEQSETSWQNWNARMREGAIEPTDYRERDWRYHVFVQHALETQLSQLDGLDAGLYLDLSVGASGSSFDCWRFQEHFASGADVGAPPDGLFEGGQNWALPPLHPRAIREHGHDYFRACIRAQMAHSSMLRIDHVMGLHRLFWIPAGMPGTEGLYVHYPADELYAILCIESHRARCAVAGEDLGTVPDDVRPMMQERGIHNLFVGEFSTQWHEADRRLGLQTPPSSAIASIDTHDTATFAGWFDTTDLQVDPEMLMRQWTEELAAGPAAAVLVTLEDLWLEKEPQNRPGTTEEVPNWRHRLRRDLDSLRGDTSLSEWLKKLDGLRRHA
jgi:4-alpha-glucanotransferase